MHTVFGAVEGDEDQQVSAGGSDLSVVIEDKENPPADGRRAGQLAQKVGSFAAEQQPLKVGQAYPFEFEPAFDELDAR